MPFGPPLDEIVRTIVAEVQPRRVVLFGSRARGDATDDSDVDLMVEFDDAVAHTVSAERRRRIYALFPRRDWSLDVLVYRTDDIDRQRDDPGTVIFDIEREGKVLYWRRPAAPSRPPSVRERPSAPASVDWWIARADSDIVAIEVLLQSGSPLWNQVQFFAQQAAERYLKVLLIRRWRRPERTHDLSSVLDMCRAAGYSLPELDEDCLLLAPYAVDSRYPADAFAAPRAVTEHEARAAEAAMQRVVAACKAALTR